LPSAAEVRPKEEISVGYVREVFFQLVVVILTAEFDGMRTNDFAVVVNDLVNVIQQVIGPARHSNDEVVEVNLWNALHAGSPEKNSRSSVIARSKT
jgi:hypothetical protein